MVHQIDLARPAPGGIDTCIRGLISHAPEGVTFAVVGVDSGADLPERELGVWERYELGGRSAWFLPVTRLDAGDQNRRVPHSLRLAMGLLRYQARLPDFSVLQAHRADVAAASSLLLRRPLAYMVHTQETGLTHGKSDSFWRNAAGVHAWIENWLIRRAQSTTVFNPDFAETAARISPTARFSPTWFEPSLEAFRPVAAYPHRVLWVGRVEEPKDPHLAVDVLAKLAELEPDTPWSLRIVGAGTLLPEVQDAVRRLDPTVASRIELLGRLAPAEVAAEMSQAGAFLMTSHPGYEGFPRVLLEAMSAGLPAVVTQGSDTGGVIRVGETGQVCGRDPEEMARAIIQCAMFDRSAVRASVDEYPAPKVVARILEPRFAEPGTKSEPALQPIMRVDDDGRAQLCGAPLFQGGREALRNKLADLIASRQVHTVITPNVDQLLLLPENPALAAAYQAASLRITDGSPLAWLGRTLGARDLHRLTGADLLVDAAKWAPDLGWRIVVTGGAPGVADEAVRQMQVRFGTDAHAVDFPMLDDISDPRARSVISRISELEPSLVFVCLGSPKQDVWADFWREELPPAVYIGAGAAVDFVAGTKRRAPAFVQRIGMEWVFRLVQEPRRLVHRYLVRGPRFLGVVFRSLRGAGRTD
ncbi:WecB/TagA/CpsF family glycosyltransferase [Mangrovimicrobium sediminis]|uniref:WecB/TagA/CpsF family glycosyltransferase n=1 Tax=Mangrovimicrobium sediminis TaxID=2562682 RepID=A0A4Z0LXK8_9GAMM|nr:WecB/TagA/CpsF family glycosyltransferase [Haliea sp. SAOS-164]TGD71877.1 WecB/TagA/CpsF family glycosyltransferase [Haliea sp. SAOS-164]